MESGFGLVFVDAGFVWFYWNVVDVVLLDSIWLLSRYRIDGENYLRYSFMFSSPSLQLNTFLLLLYFGWFNCFC